MRLGSHVAVVSTVTVAESVRVKPGPSPAPRRDVAPSNVGAIRVCEVSGYAGRLRPLWRWHGAGEGPFVCAPGRAGVAFTRAGSAR
jgi:hypothetical protein